jgi:hypothetical protein
LLNDLSIIYIRVRDITILIAKLSTFYLRTYDPKNNNYSHFEKFDEYNDKQLIAILIATLSIYVRLYLVTSVPVYLSTIMIHILKNLMVYN